MSFQLEVEFSGLCLYVLDSVNERVGVAMPDARGRTPGSTTHEDGTIGRRHVGYVRFDLADLDHAFPDLGRPTPHYEGVHLFDREELRFVIEGDAGPIVPDLALPAAESIAPDPVDPTRSAAVTIPGLFDAQPPQPVLMHTRLSGGTIIGEPEETWRFSNLWNPGQPAYEGEFASFVTWRRTVESVTLHLRRFHEVDPYLEIPLVPKGGTNSLVRVKVANFCSTNPMEWRDLGLRDVDSDDEDFKWLYRLLTPRDGSTWNTRLMMHRFPIPLFAPGGQGVQDCLGKQINGSTT
jgi:hypothetical protein